MSQSTAEREITLRDRLRLEQAQWLSLWADCAAFCCPHKQRVVRTAWAQLPVEVRPRFNPMRQSSTAIDALNVASGGCKSWLIPGGDEGWGGMWEPDPSREDSVAVKDWLADCTQRSIAPMKRGAFFTGSHEMIQDLLWAGTAGFLIDEGDDDVPMSCRAIEANNFVGQRDWKDEVMRVIITWNKSAAEIKDMFSQPGDTVPESVLRDIAANNPGALHEFIQSIYKRSDSERGEERSNEPKGQPIASCWIHVADKKVMRERGHMEMPFVAPRWNTWAGTGTSFYGTSPAMQAVADMKGLNMVDMVEGALMGVLLNPRVKVMPSQSGAIDLSEGGVTQMSEANGVQEWAASGEYNVGQDFSVRLERRIQRAFFTDLFEAITPIATMKGKDITNYIAESVQREAAARITPAVGRLEQDFFDQAMHRVFMVLYRAGVFAEPPAEAFHHDAAGQRFFILPRVVQSNRMTRVINAHKSFAYMQMMGRLQGQVALGHPEVLDSVNFAEINSDLSRGDGIPKDWLFDEETVAKMRAEKAKIAQQQMVQQVAADAAANHPMDMAKIATGNIAA